MKIQIFDKTDANDQFSFQFSTNEKHVVAVSQHTYPNRDTCVAAVEKVISLCADTTNYVNFNENGQYFFAVNNTDGETFLVSSPHTSYQDCEDTEDYLQSECEGSNQYDVSFTNFERTVVPVLAKNSVSVEASYDMDAFAQRIGAAGVDVFEDANKGGYYFLLRDASGNPFLYSRAYTRAKLRDAGLYHVLSAGEKDFEIIEKDAIYYCIVRGTSGQEVARSKNYDTRAASELAIANAISLANAAPAAYKVAPAPRAARNSGESGGQSDQYILDLPVSDGEGFETLTEKGKHFFVYKDDAGRPFVFSQAYSAASGRDNGLRSLIRNTGNSARYEIKEEEGRYYFIVRAGNRQEIARSRYFNSLAQVNEHIALLSTNAVKDAAKYGFATEEKIVASTETFSLNTKAAAQAPSIAVTSFTTSSTDASTGSSSDGGSIVKTGLAAAENTNENTATNIGAISAASTLVTGGVFVAGSNASGITESGENTFVTETSSAQEETPTTNTVTETHHSSVEETVVAAETPISIVSNIVTGGVFVAGNNASGVTASGGNTFVTITGSAQEETPTATTVSETHHSIVEETVVAAETPISIVSNIVEGGAFVAGSNASGIIESSENTFVTETSSAQEETLTTNTTTVSETHHSIVEETVVAAETPISIVSNIVTGGVFVAGNNASGVTASGGNTFVTITGSAQEETPTTTTVSETHHSIVEETVVAAENPISIVSNIVAGGAFVAGSNASGIIESSENTFVTETSSAQEETLTANTTTVSETHHSIVEETVVAAETPISIVSNIVTGGVFVAGNNASGVTASGGNTFVTVTGSAQEETQATIVTTETITTPVIEKMQLVEIAAPIVEKVLVQEPALDITDITAPVATIIGIDIPEEIKKEVVTTTTTTTTTTTSTPIIETLAAGGLATGAVISAISSTAKEVIVADKALSASLTEKTVKTDIITKQLDPIQVELPKTTVQEKITVELEKAAPIVEIPKEEIKVVKIVEEVIVEPKKPDIKVVKIDVTEKKPEVKVIKIEEKKPEVKVIKNVEKKVEVKKEEIKIVPKVEEKKIEVKPIVEEKKIVVEKKVEVEKVVERKVETKKIVEETKVEKTVAPVVVEEASTADGCMKYLPWLLGLAALAGLLFFLMRGCNDPKPPVPTTPSVTAPIAPAPIKPVVLDTVKAEKVTAPTEEPTKKATTLKSFFANGSGTQTFVMDDVCFPKNTHKMSGASIAQVPRIVKMLKDNPNAKLTIHGYSEKGEKADLWMCSDGQKRDLAATRARCLYQRLINAGAKAAQLDFIGHLDEASPNNTACPYRGLDLEVTK